MKSISPFSSASARAASLGMTWNTSRSRYGRFSRWNFGLRTKVTWLPLRYSWNTNGPVPTGLRFAGFFRGSSPVSKMCLGMIVELLK